jgi:tagatose 6-phosphate kinase
MSKKDGYILAVALNAAIDTTLVVPSAITLGESYRAAEVIKLPGGKGINVARVLHTLGVPIHVCGCVGGDPGEFIKRGLKQAGIAATMQPIAGVSRTCTAIVERATHRTTEVNEPGPAISESEARAFLDLYESLLPGAWAVAVSGSVPPGLPTDYYAEMVRRARAAGIPPTLDARGPALRIGEDALAVGRKMRELGARIVAITRGGEGVVLVTEMGAWQAGLRVGKPVSTVGSGDAFVAGFLAGLRQAVEHGTSRSLEQAVEQAADLMLAFKLAIACGTANTQRLGAGVLALADVERLQHMVEVTALS